MPSLQTTDELAEPSADAVAPVGKAYPRAAVVLSPKGSWLIRIWSDRNNARVLTAWDGARIVTMLFDTRHAAMSHAAHEIHALRARRHPAGQSWLRGGNR